MTGDGRSFRDAMEAALYDERTGYYGAGRVRFGRRGDFTTSSGVSALFGACLARWADDVRRSIGSPGEFAVVELGPGDGLLAADILRVFEGPYVCVERSAALAARQRERLIWDLSSELLRNGNRDAALADFCHALLNLNEFVYLD